MTHISREAAKGLVDLVEIFSAFTLALALTGFGFALSLALALTGFGFALSLPFAL